MSEAPGGDDTSDSIKRRRSKSKTMDTEEDKEVEFFDELVHEKIQKDMNQLLRDLENEPNIGQYFSEFENLYEIVLNYFEQGRTVVEKLEELQTESTELQRKLSDALKIQEDDHVTISALRKEIERAWKQLDDSQDKEQQQKEFIHSLETELNNIHKTFEQVPIFKAGPEAVLDLQRSRDELLRERDQILGEFTKTKDSLVTVTAQLQSSEKLKEQLEDTIKELSQENYKRKNELQKETRKREKLEMDLKVLRQELDIKGETVANLQQQIAKNKEYVSYLEHKRKENKAERDQLSKDLEVLNLRVTRIQQENDVQIQNMESLVKDNNQLATEIRAKDDELTQTRHENSKLTKTRDMLTRKLNLLEEQKTEIETSRELLKNQIIALQRELDMAKRQSEQDRKTNDELVRDREILSKNLVKAIGATQKQILLVKQHEQNRKQLELEIQNYKDMVNKQDNMIATLEKDRDRQIGQSGELSKKVYSLMEEMKLKDVQNYETKKKLIETETKLRQQINLYDAVRSDRNLFNKNLIETQDEVSEMKRKLKIMTHQIEQLKDEVNSKESALVRERLNHQKIEREKETLKTDMAIVRDELTALKHSHDALQAEHRKIIKVLMETDKEQALKKKENERMRSERDVLGAQLLRRNDEVALLYQKIQIYVLTLQRGELHYRHRLDDIRILKLEVQKLRKEKLLLEKGTKHIEELRKEVYHMHRELMRERTRCKALEEELENPINIHRWRKLEGQDPSTYELIQKIHTLQRRLIAKTEEAVEKEVLIQEKQQLYAELKNILSRQPGPEVASQLFVYQKTLNKKTRQMKGMASELNMYESQLSEKDYEIERMSSELQDIKKKYYSLKKKDERNKIKKKDSDNIHLTSTTPPLPVLPVPPASRQPSSGRYLKSSSSLPA